jgi:hypothetical protein
MKRRVAYKVARAMAEGRLTHNAETQRMTKQIIRRDFARGRTDAWLLAMQLGLVDLTPLQSAIQRIIRDTDLSMRMFARAARKVLDSFDPKRRPGAGTRSLDNEA